MSEPFLGEIRSFGFNFAPRGWAHCDGQLLPISQNTALFSLLGTIYGGDGRTTFALPDLRGRVGIHMGNGPGLPSYSIGNRGGAVEVTLNNAQIPSHSHTADVRCQSAVAAGHQNTPVGATWATDAGSSGATYSTVAPNESMLEGTVQISSTGGSQGHQNMQPYLTTNWCIALVGLFPSRS
ncbi:phage tail protein [Rhodopirellula sp. MGV]|uniref:phage tail protein n=1 Tax=Rhodopirellula sp. MGV TaxID=2023130 RepID=UPI000B97C365|nr:tail fiber protein [Rhodopirellula sp. MGV]OYP36007.1 phage tail protein [Rhodopirellula sp. MGV]PNY36635.1 phage tail protein [Rhodopirellula baltica]